MSVANTMPAGYVDAAAGRARVRDVAPAGETQVKTEAAPSAGAEARLLERLRAGDERAFEQLVRDTTGHLLAVAKRFLASEDDARDAVQDAYISAFKALPKFDGKSRLSTWLHRITVNACLMKLRSARRRNEKKLDDLLPSYMDDGHRRDVVPAWEESADQLLERRDVRAMVRAKIEELPDDYRTVLLLRDIEELDTAATAEALDISEAAVKTRLHRARQALRTLLEGELSS